ncbi:MAG: hypothetical protein QG622_3411 [Actinomycetota bacterium]|nr:hypothetical protein [Actinomycetota bacterium]
MPGMPDRVSTGLPGFDRVIDDLRLGDNVVWQVDSIPAFRRMVDRFVARAEEDGRRIVYVRFGSHEPLLAEGPQIKVRAVDPTQGFEGFATEIHNLVAREGRQVFYVFDCLTDLLPHWYSDLMIGNFFGVTCPFLYELDTIAYFAIRRDAHTHGTVARIRETTQLLLDLYQRNDKIYIHPLKVWQRYSPTMFFPHLVRDDEAVSITASSDVVELLSTIRTEGVRQDAWTVAFARARQALALPVEQQEPVRRELMRMLIGRPSRMQELCSRYFTLADILLIASREVGTGFIGGKSVGMLLARKILERDGGEGLASVLEPHDSYYLGSDVFYTYIVQNGWWPLRMKQKTREGYFAHAGELREKLLHGHFPADIRDQFTEMLERFGQSPIIVRSSSLLEDDFGNSFAGKYDSVFCANQGSPLERYEAFEDAVRVVYASTMSEDALDYRLKRGLSERDEQMAILVQRVSGDQHGDDYFPHVAGVGNSSNLYIWDPAIDMDAGMLRLAFGLGTRAVDRTVGDHLRIVCLDDPLRLPPARHEDGGTPSQRRVDVLSLRRNELLTRPLEDVALNDLKTDAGLFLGVDRAKQRRLRELGRSEAPTPYLLDFHRLLGDTRFPHVMREILSLLSTVYEYPVDLEFTANFEAGAPASPGAGFRLNVLQCRPQQTRGLGRPVPMPTPADGEGCFFLSKGDFMGGNVRIPLDLVVYVRPAEYLRLDERGKYAVARYLGAVNAAVKGQSVMLVGPGRWGTTTPSLGVPTRFAEMSNMAVIAEMSSRDASFMPELSYGSHFFQELVESGIFYVALFDGRPDVVLHPGCVLALPNVAASLAGDGGEFADVLADVVHVAKTPGMEVFADVVSQTVMCL